MTNLRIATLFLLSLPAHAQWVNGTGAVYYTGGNVGVGTTAPVTPLQVFGNASNEIARFQSQSNASNARSFVSLYTTNPSYWWELSNQDSAGGGTLNGLAFRENSYGAGNPVRLYLAEGGNVGVGTAAPAAPLHVLGSVSNEIARFQSQINSSNARSFVSLYTTNPSFWWEVSNQDPSGGGLTNGLAFRENSLGAGDPVRLYLAQGGNIGVGTSNPQYPLSVNGVIQAKEVLVDTGWSDYVFDPGYRLAPLAEVASYVQENHHLPGVPSAAEVAKKGIGVGEIQAKLLAKIEELTLHMIQAEKENRELRDRLSRLEEKSAH